MFFACCCQPQDETAPASVDQIPVVKDAQDLGLVGVGEGGQDRTRKSGLDQAVQDGDVTSLTVNVSDTEEMGMIFDSSGVTAIHVSCTPKKDSAFGRANAAASSGMGLQEGDYIVSINGFAGDSGRMIQEALSKNKLEVQASRPFTFTINADKTDHSLGCIINYDLDIGSSLLIEEIKPGAVQAWNEANPDKLVKANDRIVAVDGRTGNGTELLDMIKARKGPMELSISRPKWMPTDA